MEGARVVGSSVSLKKTCRECKLTWNGENYGSIFGVRMDEGATGRVRVRGNGPRTGGKVLNAHGQRCDGDILKDGQDGGGEKEEEEEEEGGGGRGRRKG